MYLPETAHAIQDLSANVAFGQGDHDSVSVKAGGPGLIMGAVPFDPFVHEWADIKPGSMMEMVTGLPHVEMVRPARPVVINVITDYSGMNYYEPMTKAKRRAAQKITNGLIDSIQSVTDRIDTYTIGAKKDELPDMYTEELTGEHASQIEKAEAIADVAAHDYTIVISDFTQLPMESVRADFSRTVGVKLNHLLERKIPANIGVIAVSGVEVNTNKSRKLSARNTELQRAHEASIYRLAACGLRVASIITRADVPSGIDVAQTDVDIANAIQAIYRK